MHASFRIRAALLAGTVLLPTPVLHARTVAASPQTGATSDSGDGGSIETVKTDLGEIVVTARHYVPQGAATANKTDIPLIETPQSISVITRDQIDLLSFIDAQQAVRYTAGVFGENYGPDPRFDFITVRGFTPKQYIDGLAVPNTTTISATGVDIYAFQSLDILKGPASVLYGAAPPGGILNEVSRRPSSEFGGELLGKYGTDDFKEVAGTVTGPAAPYLDVRFTGLFRDTDTDIDHTSVKRVLAAPSATLKLGDSTKLTGLLYYQYDRDTGGNGGFLPLYGTLRPNPTGLHIDRSTNLDDPATLYLRRQTGAGYDLEHKFSDNFSFFSNTKWSQYEEETPTGLYSGGGYANTTDPTLPSYYRTLNRFNFSYREEVVSFATDNRLNATLATGPATQKLLAGIDYRNVKNVADFGFTGGGQIDAFDPVYDPAFQRDIGYPIPFNDQRLRQTGVYGQDQIGYGNFFLLLSGRYDWVKADDRLADDSQKEHKFTYRAGLSYVSPSGLAPYVSYATSFEPVLGTATTGPDAGQAFRPTATKQIEGGVKFDARGLPHDVKLFATLAGFDIKERNFVVAQVGSTPIGGQQGGLVEVHGGEFELVARIREQLSINAAYSYNRSRIREGSDPADRTDVGAPLPVTPRHKASIFADYTLRGGPLAGFGFGGGVRYNSRSAGGLPSTTFGYYILTGQATLFDATVHYDIPGWRFQVNASNLADKDYVARCTGLYGCLYGAGRQVIGSVIKRF